MVEGKRRSRTFRRVYVKTPGAKTVIHWRRRKPSPAICAICGARLAGVPRDFPRKMQNTSKTKKRPERPYGGTLCTRCARRKILVEARSQ